VTFMHIGSVTAASVDPVVVELQNANCFDFGITVATAGLSTKATGIVECDFGGLFNTSFNWIDPLGEAPGSPEYQVMRGAEVWNSIPGLLQGPNQGVWTSVASNPRWYLHCTTTFFGPIIIAECSFTVSIRQGTGPVIDTATWTIGIECGTLN